jgi:hypothetical protein
MQRELEYGSQVGYRASSLVPSVLDSDPGALTGPVPLRHPRPPDHHDAELEPLREAPLAFPLQLPRADLHRDDRREQSDQQRAVATDRAWYGLDPYERDHRCV